MATKEMAATEVLSKLIQFNTVNPPGNERECQEWLFGYLKDAGFECELVGATPERPNLIARLKGDKPGPVLAYLGHVDTVTVDPPKWERDPWCGEIHDGELWGRGALDMKGQVAAEVAAAVDLAKGGWRPPSGELKLIIVVDEEVQNTPNGAWWLCTEEPDRVYCDMLINEGAGDILEYKGRQLYSVAVGEKGIMQFRVTAPGAPSHGSLPKPETNALLHLLPAIEYFANKRIIYHMSEPAKAILDALGEDTTDPQQAVKNISQVDPLLGAMVEATLGITFNPTMVRASQQINVLPSQAEVDIDCRIPPRLSLDAALAMVKEAAKEIASTEHFTLEPISTADSNDSAFDSPLMDGINTWLSTAHPGAETIPNVCIGFTDSHWFRGAFPECVAYGFFPARYQPVDEVMKLIHGHNERIDVRDLELGTDFFTQLPRIVLGA
jgi:acetylornithine deacetylase/succinyl-diaminopimelate desuccinylase-like protein